MTQLEFAAFLEVSVSNVHDWEQGRHKPNTAAVTLLKLAESGKLKKPKRQKPKARERSATNTPSR